MKSSWMLVAAALFANNKGPRFSLTHVENGVPYYFFLLFLQLFLYM